MAGSLENKANSVQLQLQLLTGTELGNSKISIKFEFLFVLFKVRQGPSIARSEG